MTSEFQIPTGACAGEFDRGRNLASSNSKEFFVHIESTGYDDRLAVITYRFASYFVDRI